MGRSCCVPGCRSNYYGNDGYVPVFHFPQDPVRQRIWVKSIGRENYQVTKNSAVCIKHFAPDFLITHTSVTCPDGTKLKILRKKKSLTENAYPSIFKNLVLRSTPMKLKKKVKNELVNRENERPSVGVALNFTETKSTNSKKTNKTEETTERQENEAQIDLLPLSSSKSSSRTTRKSTKKTKTESVNQENEIQIDWLKSEEINSIDELDENVINNTDELNSVNETKNNNETDNITSIYDITSNLSKFINHDFIMNVNDDRLYFLRIDYTNVPTLQGTIIIDNNLNVEMFHKGVKLDVNEFEWILGSDGKCNSFSKLEFLLNGLNNYTSSNNNTLDENVTKIKKLLNECSNETNNNNNNKERLSFMCEQLDCMFSEQLTYSADYLLLSFSVFYNFPSAYRFLRELDLFNWPHPNYLKMFNLSSNVVNSSLKECLEKKIENVAPRERKVYLTIDEIYIKPKTSCKSNATDEHVTAVQTFVITSLVSKNKDLVALVPVVKLESKTLHETTTKVLSLLNDTGYEVVCIVSNNNNPVSVELFKELSGGDGIKSCIKNPFDDSKEIYLLFDAAQLIKNIRNDWLDEKTFLYPSLDDFDNLNVCEFSHITQIYDYQESSGTKYAPALTYEVCYPNNLERQNVKLALQLFDEQVIDLIDSCSHILNDNSTGTSRWLNIIKQWWSIVSLKHPDEPIYTLDQPNVDYLKTFCEWLEKWYSWTVLKSGETVGKLRPETYFALLHTTKALLKLCDYLLNKLEFSYVMLGVFQPDEQKFGKHRGVVVSGCNSTGFIEQILAQSEMKLNLVSLLKLKCSGVEGFKMTDVIQLINESNYCNANIETYAFLDKSDHILADCSCNNEIKLDVLEGIIFISSCVVFKASQKLSCASCKEKLVQDRDLNFETSAKLSCIDQLNKGGLKYPTVFAVQVAVSIYRIFHVLVSKKYEKVFLECSNKTEALKSLLFEQVLIEDVEPCSVCGKSMVQILNDFVNVWISIFLKNYPSTSDVSSVKLRGQKRKTVKCKRPIKCRKLSTIQL